MEAASPLQRCNDVVMRFLNIADFDSVTPEVVGELLAAFSSLPQPPCVLSSDVGERDAQWLARYRKDLERLREQLLRFEDEALARRERLVREYHQLAATAAWNKSRSATY